MLTYLHYIGFAVDYLENLGPIDSIVVEKNLNKVSGAWLPHHEIEDRGVISGIEYRLRNGRKHLCFDGDYINRLAITIGAEKVYVYFNEHHQRCGAIVGHVDVLITQY